MLPSHEDRGEMPGVATLHLAGDVSACETPQRRLAGRRIWQEEARALRKSRCHPRRASAAEPHLRMDGLRAAWLRCSPLPQLSQDLSRFSPLAGNFNLATFISPLPSRDVGGTGRVGSVSGPCSAVRSAPGGGTPRRAILGRPLVTNIPRLLPTPPTLSPAL